MIEVEAPSEFVCPLTLDVMSDPVVSKYGQSFERSEILQWLRSGNGVCPLSRRPLSLQDLVTNHSLRMKIEHWRRENGDNEANIVVKPSIPEIYGFITLPDKEDGTDRTLDDDEDLFYLQLAALRLGHPVPQAQASNANSSSSATGRRRTRQRRASTGSQSTRRQSSHRAGRRPLRALRNLFTASGSSR